MNTRALWFVLVAGCTVGSGEQTSPDGGVAEPDDDGFAAEPLAANPEKAAFDFFVGKGLTRIQSAGIVGNLMQESTCNPRAVQYGGGPGRGIAQWSVGGRWNVSHHDNVAWYANAHGLSRWSLHAQLDFIWYELNNFSYGLHALRAANTVTEAVVAFQNRYEICGACDSSQRISYARQALARY